MRIIFQVVALIAVIIIAVVVLAAGKAFAPRPPALQPIASTTANVENSASSTDADVIVDSPKPSSMVVSPLNVSGKARGTWYFEAVFPIVIVDWDGRVIGEGQAHSEDSWTTTDFVPFSTSIVFTKPICANGQDYCKKGAVIFKRDNPSGLPQNDASVEIPVVFE